jgi:hypothetical protein
VAFERHYSEHCGVSRRADCHGISSAHRFRQRYEPVALDARLLGISAEMRFATAPAIEHDFVTGPPGGVV